MLVKTTINPQIKVLQDNLILPFKAPKTTQRFQVYTNIPEQLNIPYMLIKYLPPK